MTALVVTVVRDLIALAGRTNAYGPASRPKIEQAVCAVLADLLPSWNGDSPRLVYRSLAKASFTGEPVSFRHFKAALDGLRELGLVHRHAAIRYRAEARFGFSDTGSPDTGKAARYWPTAELLQLAERSGVGPADLDRHFSHVYSAKPPLVPAPILLRPFKTREARKQQPERPPDYARSSVARQLRSEVEEVNAFAADFVVTGCRPPRWCRRFTGTLDLHGRWYSVGGAGAYQSLSSVERVRDIRIGGEPVVEVDVRASWLTIVLGLNKLEPSLDDPYAVDGDIDRAIVKAWITATLGKGSPVSRWAPQTVKKMPALASQSAVEARRVILRCYPCLAALEALTESLETPTGAVGVLPAYLMGLEAAALTLAMRGLRGRGVLALPVHDALIVPVSAAAECEAGLKAAFLPVAGACPTCRVVGAASLALWGSGVAGR
jgi:hypothetical protein